MHPVQIGTKPAKVGHLAANLLKYVPKKKKKKVPLVGSNPGLMIEFGVKAGVLPLRYAEESAGETHAKRLFVIYIPWDVL